MVMDKLQRSKSARGKAVVIGCMATMMPTSTSSYFGVILIYIYSYFHAHTSNFGLDPLWILSTYRVTIPLGMLGSSYVSQKLGDFKAVLVFSAVQVGSSFLCFYSIDHPLALLVMFGMMQGIGAGALFNLSWTICFNSNRNSNSGWATGLMSSGSSVGALLVAGLSYVVMNPTNEESDKSTGRMRYFTNPDVVHRVPYFFIMLGMFNFLILGIGIAMIYCALRAEESLGCDQAEDDEMKNIASPCEEKDPIINNYRSEIELSNLNGSQAQETSEYGALKKNEYGDTHRRSDLANKIIFEPKKEGDSSPEEGMDMALHNQPSTESSVTKDTHKSSQGQPKSPIDTHERKFSPTSSENSVSSETSSSDVIPGLTPRQMLQTPSFWLLWTIKLLLNATMFIHSNLYKQMGEVYLSNDALLTGAGVLSQAAVILTRPCNGHFVHTLGVKVGLMLTSGTSTVFIMLMMISLNLWPPLYVIFVICEFACITTIFMQFHYATKAMFGPAHYSTNVSLVFTGSLPVCVVLPIVIPDLVEVLGWTHLFTLAASFSCIALVLSLACPDKEKQYNDNVV